MIIRKEPKDKENYVIVTSNDNIILHRNGFIPRFMSFDGELYFYTRSDNILSFIKDNNLKALD